MKYQKGWSDPLLHAQFLAALESRDCWAAGVAIREQGAERPPVDVGAMFMSTRDRQLLSYKDEQPVGSTEFAAELELVADLVHLRDDQLADLTVDLPDGFTKLSMFLKDIKVDNAANGVDFITTMDEWLSISRNGDVPKAMPRERNKTLIKTGRDLATYVHDDNPFEQWGRVISVALSEGVAVRTEESVDDLVPHCGKFACYGFPYLMGAVGEVIRRAGVLSFSRKWESMVPRPEEASVGLRGVVLPQCYPEGSPMHPSRNAMHSIAALASMHLLLKFFRGAHVMSSGKTFEQECKLFAENIGYGRVWAGVHYPYDHVCVDETAAKVADATYRQLTR